MRKIILTAVDDNDEFYYNHLISFLLSLENTDYDGDIGIISYDLSPEKQQVLIQNGCIIFNAPKKYQSIFLDRQFTVKLIAEQFNYDQLALYDTDILFPNKELTIFSQIIENQKLYLSRDFMYSQFIEDCIKDEFREDISTKIKSFLNKNGFVWQVGVMIGHKSAWQNYIDYLEDLLNSNKFIDIFGIDTTAICLYSIEKDGIAILSEKYNCLPSSKGFHYTNIDADNSVMSRRLFRYNDENIEGLHVVGPYREWGRNFYEYSNHYGSHFYSEGKKYRPFPTEYRQLDINDLISLENNPSSDKVILNAVSIISEENINYYLDKHDLIIVSTAGFQLTLKNPLPHNITLFFAVQSVLDYKLSLGRFIFQKGKDQTIYFSNKWFRIEFEPNEEVILCSYDLDNKNAKLSWRFHHLQLI